VQTLASKQLLCINDDLKDTPKHFLNHSCNKLRQSRRLDESNEACQGSTWMEHAQNQQKLLMQGSSKLQ